MRSLFQALGLSVLLLWPMGPAFGKPVPEPETSRAKSTGARGKVGRKKNKKKRSRKRSRSRGRQQQTTEHTPPRKPSACQLKSVGKLKTVKLDSEVEALFNKMMVIDGTLSPTYRGDCCKDEDKCSPKKVGETKHSCYNNLSPPFYTEITEKMGVNMGGGPYWDEGAAFYDQRERDGRKIKVVRTLNDMDAARWQGKYANILYIQSWDEEHYNLDPIPLARHLYNHGARIVQIAYNKSYNDELKTVFAGGAKQDKLPLSQAGRDLVNSLLDHYIMVDVSHLGNKSALDVIAMGKQRKRPITVNHANAITIFDDRNSTGDCGEGCASRNHTDEVICAVANTDGIYGISPIRFMLAGQFNGEYVAGTENDFIEHLDYVAKGVRCTSGKRVLDMTKYVGVSSDGSINGYAEKTEWVHSEMGTDVDRWKRVASRLKNECGYSLRELGRIFGGNFDRVYRATLPGIRRPKVKSPADGASLAVSKVKFAWKRPKVNRPGRGSTARYTIISPKKFTVVVQKKRRGKYRKHRKRSVGNKTSAVMTLKTGDYRWYVQATNGKQTVNSKWKAFTRK